VARAGRLDRFEPGAMTDRIRDGLIDRLAVEFTGLGGRNSGGDGRQAGPMLEVWIVIDHGAQATEDAYLFLVRLQGGELLCRLVIGAQRLRHKQFFGKAASPEIGPEARGNPLAGVGQGLTIAVQEAIEQRQRHCHGAALECAAKKEPAIECHRVLATGRNSWPFWRRPRKGERRRNSWSW